MARSRSRSPEARSSAHRPRDSYRYRSKERERPVRRNYSPSRARYDDRTNNDRASYRPVNAIDQTKSDRPSYRPVNDLDDRRRPDHKTATSEQGRSAMRSSGDHKRVSEMGNITPPTDKTAESSSEEQMAAMMGFGGFGTTKGAKVKGNEAGGVSKPAKKVEYRQYMNRPGGFNRPLDS